MASKSTGLSFKKTDFGPGLISALTVVPLESGEVQDHTRYTVHIWPTHDIETDSIITIKFPASINLTEGACTVQNAVSPMSTLASCQVASNMVTVTNPFSTGSFAADS